MRKLSCIFAVFVLAASQALQGALISDDFESYTADSQLPSPWTTVSSGSITINTVDTEQSPFGEAGDTQAVLFSDTATDDPTTGAFTQSFASSETL